MITAEGLLDSARKDSGITNPVFVVGVLRSGTSLLYSLLNQHPQIALMYECDAWSFPEPLSRWRFKGNWLERQEFYNHALSRHRLIYSNNLRGLENVRTPADLYRVFGNGKQATLWGEKSPFYCFRLQQLAKRSPGSPFILIWRDPVEVYRSVRVAGRTTSYFRRPGMLSRLILYYEEMLLQAEALEKAGLRVHHVTYSELVDKTSEVCQGICKFLGVPFEPQMADLGGADLSAVYYAAQHDHLRTGVIQRRSSADDVLPPKIAAKLERFRNRWSRTHRERFSETKSALNAPEPSLLERGYHQITGNLLCYWDDAKRALFEFLPFSWLRTYRETARWFFAPRQDSSEPKLSWRQQIKMHWATIVVSYLLLAVLAGLDVLNPHLSFLPFYSIPCSILALTINWRWGTCAALVTAGIGPAILSRTEESFAQLWIFAWNTSMRFLLLQFLVLLWDRVRREVASSKSENL
jgi:hypothetical protein